MPVYIKKLSQNDHFRRKISKFINFWENFNENVIFEILDLKYRTSYQPIKASVFKFLFILSSFNFWSFLVKIEQSNLIIFDRFWRKQSFLSPKWEWMKFFNPKSQIFGFKITWIFSTINLSRDFVTLFQIDKNLFELFLNQQRLVWNLKFFSNYKNPCFSVCKNFWAEKGHFCRLENSPLN